MNPLSPPEQPTPGFPDRSDQTPVEATDVFTPRFDADGLIPCITTDAESGEVLMVAFMNALALRRTIQTRSMHYWSRSRNELWHKGASSGLTQQVVELRTDCDQDAILARVSLGQTASGAQASCHVGYRSCFYRAVTLGPASGDAPTGLTVVGEKVFDADEVYGKQ